MAALLILQTAVDEGLGACFFGVPAGTSTRSARPSGSRRTTSRSARSRSATARPTTGQAGSPARRQRRTDVVTAAGIDLSAPRPGGEGARRSGSSPAATSASVGRLGRVEAEAGGQQRRAPRPGSSSSPYGAGGIAPVDERPATSRCPMSPRRRTARSPVSASSSVIAQPPHVGRRGQPAPARLLGREVAPRAGAGSAVAGTAGEAEVDQHGPAVVDDDVGGLHVEVQPVVAVQVAEHRGELAAELGDVGERERRRRRPPRPGSRRRSVSRTTDGGSSSTP